MKIPPRTLIAIFIVIFGILSSIGILYLVFEPTPVNVQTAPPVPLDRHMLLLLVLASLFGLRIKAHSVR
ncbi:MULTISPECIES: hypothetical protein [unclassified Flavobacterium]|uniref:hypothetical protein n=1 Tax=unclassified Flavobacterium TaxID=196869 RepID=UPI001F14246B|nr:MULTISPECIES: hypothetical protein [unclassified Flavobacterium]UMY66868.1 hypothetical protein MKO97_05660 [Flavobacterium sp. HJ-32-4]